MSIGADRFEIARWVVCGLVVFSAHAGASAYLMSQSMDGEVAGSEFAIEVNLDAEPAAPLIGQMEANQGLQQTQTEETSQASVAQEQKLQSDLTSQQQQQKQTESVALANSDATLPRPNDSNAEAAQANTKSTDNMRQERSEARLESAPMAAPIAAPQLAPQPVLTKGVNTDDRATFMSWKTLLGAHVQRFKQYPAEAVAQGLHGKSVVAMTIDRSGRVVASAIQKTSGTALLDREALATVARASPFPPPPRNVADQTFDFDVEIRFNVPR